MSTETYYMDYTPYSCVIVCLHENCSYRTATINRASAWALLRKHQRAAHPQDISAREALARHKRYLRDNCR